MNKTVLSFAVIASSSLILGGCSLLPSKEVGAPQTQKEVANEAKQFADAIKSGQPTYCVMTKGTDVMEYWVKGKMFKMNSTITTTDEETKKTTTTNGHMISDTSYMYSWSNDTKQGMKLKIPTEQEVKEMTENAKKYEDAAPKLDDEAGYDKLQSEGYTINCKGASMDDSDFVPPTDINFVDPTAMMKGITKEGGQLDMKAIEEMAKKYQQDGE